MPFPHPITYKVNFETNGANTIIHVDTYESGLCTNLKEIELTENELHQLENEIIRRRFIETGCEDFGIKLGEKSMKIKSKTDIRIKPLSTKEIIIFKEEKLDGNDENKS
jgi:hypothetical protein